MHGGATCLLGRFQFIKRLRFALDQLLQRNLLLYFLRRGRYASPPGLKLAPYFFFYYLLCM